MSRTSSPDTPTPNMETSLSGTSLIWVQPRIYRRGDSLVPLRPRTLSGSRPPTLVSTGHTNRDDSTFVFLGVEEWRTESKREITGDNCLESSFGRPFHQTLYIIINPTVGVSISRRTSSPRPSVLRLTLYLWKDKSF